MILNTGSLALVYAVKQNPHNLIKFRSQQSLKSLPPEPSFSITLKQTSLTCRTISIYREWRKCLAFSTSYAVLPQYIQYINNFSKLFLPSIFFFRNLLLVWELSLQAVAAIGTTSQCRVQAMVHTQLHSPAEAVQGGRGGSWGCSALRSRLPGPGQLEALQKHYCGQNPATQQVDWGRGTQRCWKSN